MQPITSEIQQPVKHHEQSHFNISRSKGLKDLLHAFIGTKAFLTLLFDESGDLAAVGKLSTSLVGSSAFRLAVEEMKLLPEVADIIAERYMAPAHDLDALLQYPQDSLGYIYASSMKRAGFHALSAEVPINSEASYVENRWQQTHDIWHVVTGFDTSEVGEIALQAFYLAQFRLPLASMLIANALIAATLWEPEILSALLEAIALGWEMGHTAKPLIAQKWEEAWEKPVSVWRKELNIKANRGH